MLTINILPGTYFKYTYLLCFLFFILIILNDVNGIYKYYFYFLNAENYNIGNTLLIDILLVYANGYIISLYFLFLNYYIYIYDTE